MNLKRMHYQDLFFVFFYDIGALSWQQIIRITASCDVYVKICDVLDAYSISSFRNSATSQKLM